MFVYRSFLILQQKFNEMVAACSNGTLLFDNTVQSIIILFYLGVSGSLFQILACRNFLFSFRNVPL